MLIGYMRPYQDDLNCEDQLENLKKSNCTTIISEEHSSAKKRIQLKNMISILNKDDTIVITKLFALGDSTFHLVELLETIGKKGAYLKSLTEEIDTSSETGYDFTDIVKHLVQFQSDVISERTIQGLHEAKQKGITTGRPRKSDKNVNRAIIMYQSRKYSLNEIKAETGISKSTLYRYLEH